MFVCIHLILFIMSIRWPRWPRHFRVLLQACARPSRKGLPNWRGHRGQPGRRLRVLHRLNTDCKINTLQL